MRKHLLFVPFVVALAGLLFFEGAVRGNALPEVAFVDETATVAESEAAVHLDVTLSQSSTLTATVGYETRGGSAVAGQDFLTSTGTLTFTPGITLQNVTVSLLVHLSGSESLVEY
ncbi:MAG: Calx-beta domain-containing protein [Anaerolineae bacterium]